MNTLIVRLGGMDDIRNRIAVAAKLASEGKDPEANSTLNFASYEDMHRILAPSRLALVKTLAGQGALSIRELARRVGRDVQAVHRDVTTLINSGVIERSDKGVEFPYENIHFEFDVRAAA
ncbi:MULTISPECIES: winged helix-turn-helix transcriptional regulator [Sinorhizobium]|jgi:predicted transcriptional regulator|uniref:Uncharacterized protein n=6 Tax=Sinorhizobium TaxID=28105 RepID=Q92NS8_RHIME|nr:MULTISPECIES: winged helix-turn-helix transcriptional regulator [Sinorhizobium]PST25066.1 transcriptional regulator [Mesorhizobium loti]AEG04829.1 hypothetical protein SinmeB_1921 [Sinorhizobium meliloti BL225C]AEG53800.1 hypothetical protein Sinme_2077 [Sinorhizobium meliloti AK83]AEH78497.1 hypothetical protein SM11_chr1220 [Sinorhizobium meliloti SM11]AGA07080.1 putative transcriptional regulator [Sinorhizobium meliloti GR4]